MTYTEIENEVTANLGDGDAQISLLAVDQDFRTVAKCLNKTFPEQFQGLRRPDLILAEYLALRTSLAAAADSTAVFLLWTPGNVFLAKYGVNYLVVHAVYVAQFTTAAWPDPQAKATQAMLDESIRLADLLNVQNAQLC